MLIFYLLSISFVASGIMSSVGAISSVTITTSPKQGPFRLLQTVFFSCEVEPAPSDPVTYQWRNVDSVDGVGLYLTGSFNRTYYPDNLRYCWYFCTVSLNGTVLGKAHKLFEVHGLLQTDEPITRAFFLHDEMAMRINIYNYYSQAQFISSLAWHHNGTELISDNRVTITNNWLSLTISNMTESDAGKYEVRINTILPELNSTNSRICDMNILPMLENLALYAPVTFLLQKFNPPIYNPEAVIVDNILPTYQCTPQQSFTVDNIFKFNIAAVVDTTRIQGYLLRDGVLINNINTYNNTVSYANITTQSLRITYSNVDDITGHYVYQGRTTYNDISRQICPRYIDYVYLFNFPTFVHYWNIRSSNAPILHLLQEKSVLTVGEINTLECDVINCIPANISLWHNKKVLVQKNGTHLQHQIKTAQFGVFICKADNISNSSLVQEKAQMQLLLEAKESMCCGTARDLQITMAALLKTLCGDCNIDVNNLEEIYLNYSTSGKSAYFTADFIYSNSEGTVTSSTLITRLWSWLLARETPNITVSGSSIALSKKCPVPANSVTKEACVNQMLSSEQATTTIFIPAFAGLATGIFMGAIGATSMFLLACCLCRRRSKSQDVANDKHSEEDDMSINLAYGIERHYMEPRALRLVEKDTADHVYEYPAHDT